MKISWTSIILSGLFGLSLGFAGIYYDTFVYWALSLQFIIFGLANYSQAITSNVAPVVVKK